MRLTKEVSAGLSINLSIRPDNNSQRAVLGGPFEG